MQRRVTLSQADKIHDAKERIAELEKLLAEALSISKPHQPDALLKCPWQCA
jgi:hypothetical protein